MYHRVSCRCIREARDGPDGPMRLKLNCTKLYDSRVYKHLVSVNGGPPTAIEDYQYHHLQTPRYREDPYDILERHLFAFLFRPCGLCRPEHGDLNVYGVLQCYHVRLFPRVPSWSVLE